MASKLWQILLKIKKPPIEETLTCDECFILLDHLVSNLPKDTYWESLHEAALQHLEYCPNCREHHLHRLNAMNEPQLNWWTCPWPKQTE